MRHGVHEDTIALQDVEQISSCHQPGEVIGFGSDVDAHVLGEFLLLRLRTELNLHESAHLVVVVDSRLLPLLYFPALTANKSIGPDLAGLELEAELRLEGSIQHFMSSRREGGVIIVRRPYVLVFQQEGLQIMSLPPGLLDPDEHVVTAVVGRIQTLDPVGDLFAFVKQVGELLDCGEILRVFAR